jgi:hypothetical protein
MTTPKRETRTAKKTADTGKTLTAEQLAEMLSLTREADSVELKLTVPDESRRSAVNALAMDPLNAQIRQVVFFDTPDLQLNRHGLVVRARRVQQRPNDSVVKMRPCIPHELPGSLRKSPNLVVEVDAMPGGFVCSATMKHQLAGDDVRQVVAGKRAVRKLFSKEQRAYYEMHAPEGIALDDLSVLGPINVFKLKFAPKKFPYRLVAELWNYPDGSRILELSTKCLPDRAFQVAAETRGFLAGKEIDLGAEQQTKTATALQFFAAELSA